MIRQPRTVSKRPRKPMRSFAIRKNGGSTTSTATRVSREPGFQDFNGFEDIFSSFSDIFEDFFGFSSGRRSRGRAQRGADLRYNLPAELYGGGFWNRNGNSGRKRATLHHLWGRTGVVREPDRKPAQAARAQARSPVSQGFFTVRTTCPTCRGRGAAISHPCPDCSGTGQIRSQEGRVGQNTRWGRFRFTPSTDR